MLTQHIYTDCDQAYNELGYLVRRIARRHAKRYRLDANDCIGEANVLFVEAFKSFDATKGTLKARIVATVARGLIDRLRAKIRRDRQMQYVPLPSGWSYGKRCGLPGIDHYASAEHRFDAFDARDVLDPVSADAKVIIQLVLDAPEELALAVENLGRDASRWQLRRVVMSYVRATLRWRKSRIRAAFRDAATVLS